MSKQLSTRKGTQVIVIGGHSGKLEAVSSRQFCSPSKPAVGVSGPGSLWQGKRTEEDPLAQRLSRQERQRVADLAVSVWDDDDDGDNVGGRYNYGNPDDSGDELAARAASLVGGKDITYDGEL